ncbi:hypothetical protein ABW21_db0201372 [Orbilia brochopaga]|nr:hypothetical protein ABW21_db0201372 [Drechslerella brochopaga]
MPKVPAGADPIKALHWLWKDEVQSFKTAKLLYVPLFPCLRNVCPEIDWTKLEQWITWYRPRRPEFDHHSYLRDDDVETFLDFMLEHFPISKLWERARVVNPAEFERKLITHFDRYDTARAKQLTTKENKSKDEVSTTGALPVVESSAGSPERIEISGLSSSTDGQTADPGYSSSVTSADTANVPTLVIPENRRRVVGVITRAAVERVTRAMLAINNNLDPEDIHPSKLPTSYPVNGVLQDSNGAANLRARAESGRLSKNKKRRDHKLAMKAYLEAQDAAGADAQTEQFQLPLSYQNSDGTQFAIPNTDHLVQDIDHLQQSPARSTPASTYEEAMEWPFSATPHSASPVVEHVEEENPQDDQTIYPLEAEYTSLEIAQPTPTSSRTQAQLHYMGNYPAYETPDNEHDPQTPYGAQPPTPYQAKATLSYQSSSYGPESHPSPQPTTSQPVPAHPAPVYRVPQQATYYMPQQQPFYPHPDPQAAPFYPAGQQPTPAQQAAFYPPPHDQQSTPAQHAVFYPPQQPTPTQQGLFYPPQQQGEFHAPVQQNGTQQNGAQQNGFAAQPPTQDAAGYLEYLMEHGTPIGPDTTPHLAMFTEQRRMKEREEQEAFARQQNQQNEQNLE